MLAKGLIVESRKWLGADLEHDLWHMDVRGFAPLQQVGCGGRGRRGQVAKSCFSG